MNCVIFGPRKLDLNKLDEIRDELLDLRELVRNQGPMPSNMEAMRGSAILFAQCDIEGELDALVKLWKNTPDLPAGGVGIGTAHERVIAADLEIMRWLHLCNMLKPLKLAVLWL